MRFGFKFQFNLNQIKKRKREALYVLLYGLLYGFHLLFITMSHYKLYGIFATQACSNF